MAQSNRNDRRTKIRMKNEQALREPTSAQLEQGQKFVQVVADSIRELRSVEADQLYRCLAGRMERRHFDLILRILVRAGLIRRQRDMLHWIG
jgi:hypothetical protein